MEFEPSRKFVLAAHIAGWLIFFTLPVLLAPGPGIMQYISHPEMVLGSFTKNLIWMALFYVNVRYLTPAVLKRKVTATFFIQVVLIAVAIAFLVGSIDLVFDEIFPRGVGGPPPPSLSSPPRTDEMQRPERGPFLGGPLFSNFLTTLIVLAVGSLMVLWNNWRTAREREQERMLQKVSAELSLLKLQISPHFLFNTLNNIRWLVRSESKMAEPAIVKLSQLLRYILYQTNTDLVPLEKELAHLRDFISLQEMRLTNTGSFQLQITGHPQNKQIVPLLFLPIAENFFKYGDFEGEYINTIKIDITGNELNFSTTNKILRPEHSLENGPGGIGMGNLSRRLILHYPQDHSLTIREENDVYYLAMKIQLH